MEEENNKESSESEAVESSTALAVNTHNDNETLTVDRKENLLNEFVQVATKQIEIRNKELSIKEKEIDHAHEYSMKALDVQAGDLQQERSYDQTSRRDYLKTGVGGAILVIAFLVYCLYSGHADIAQKIVEIGGTALLTGTSAYYYGKSKGKDEAEQDDE